MAYKLVKSQSDKLVLYSSIFGIILFFYILPKLLKEEKKNNFIEEFGDFGYLDLKSNYYSERKYLNSYDDSEVIEFKKEGVVDLVTDLEKNKNLTHKVDCRYECCNFRGNDYAPRYLKGKNGLRKRENLSTKIYTCSKGCYCLSKNDINRLVSKKSCNF
jgi:hypothetical protein